MTKTTFTSIIILIVFLACSKDEPTQPTEIIPPEYEPITGHWSGVTGLFYVGGNGDKYDVDLLISDTNTDLDGSGNLTSHRYSTSFPVTLDGNVIDKEISFVLTQSGTNSWNFWGDLVGDTIMMGKINGGALSDIDLELKKE